MTNKRPVRTRFAPSPTGPLHIGGVRTALFGWLLARHHDGQFILRIEDTDQNRFVPGSVDLTYQALDWLGLTPDEGPRNGGDYGPYVQSERLELYQKWANWLVENNKAYRCYCTSERLAKVNDEKDRRKEPRGYDRHCRNLTPEQVTEKGATGLSSVIRFKLPLDGKVVTHDLIRGEVEFNNSTLQDIVILKSDGFPTYHLAHVIDDHFMEISHVTRAVEWLPSLPIHVQMWQAFGWDIPKYAHLPVLLNPDSKGKLSKRTTSFDQNGQKVLVLAHEYIKAGYYAPAVVNFLTNIGWNFGDEREVFDVEEAIARFDISQVNPANSAFPMDKLDWLNGIYIREKMSDEELARELRKPLEAAGLEVNAGRLLKIVPGVRERIQSFNDIVDMAGFFFHERFKPPTADMLIQKKMDAESTTSMLSATHDALTGIDNWSTQMLYESIKELVGELGLKNGQVFGGLRVAVTGQKVSPPTFETMEILGKDESLERIQIAINILT